MHDTEAPSFLSPGYSLRATTHIKSSYKRAQQHIVKKVRVHDNLIYGPSVKYPSCTSVALQSSDRLHQSRDRSFQERKNVLAVSSSEGRRGPGMGGCRVVSRAGSTVYERVWRAMRAEVSGDDSSRHQLPDTTCCWCVKHRHSCA